MEIKNRQKRRERKKRVAILMLVIVASVISLALWQNQQNKAQEAAKKVEEAKDKSKKDKSDKKDTFDREKLAAAGCPETLLILQSAIRRPSILSKAILIMTALLLTEIFPQRFSRARFRCSCNGTSVGDTNSMAIILWQSQAVVLPACLWFTVA